MEKKRHRRNIETMQGLKEIVHLIVFISQQLPQRRKTYNCNKKKQEKKIQHKFVCHILLH